jgi:hypothetical protein
VDQEVGGSNPPSCTKKIKMLAGCALPDGTQNRLLDNTGDNKQSPGSPEALKPPIERLPRSRPRQAERIFKRGDRLVEPD